MDAAPAPASVSSSSAPPARRARPRWLSRRVWGVAVIVLAAAAYGLALLVSPRAPVVRLDDADPAVAEVLRRARTKVQLWPWSAKNWGGFATLLFVHDFY